MENAKTISLQIISSLTLKQGKPQKATLANGMQVSLRIEHKKYLPKKNIYPVNNLSLANGMQVSLRIEHKKCLPCK